MIVTPEQIAQMVDLKQKGVSMSKIARDMGVNKYTVYKHTIPGFSQKMCQQVMAWQKRKKESKKGIIVPTNDSNGNIKENLNDNEKL